MGKIRKTTFQEVLYILGYSLSTKDFQEEVNTSVDPVCDIKFHLLQL